MLGGLAGTFVPVVPGAPIILVAAVIHKYFPPIPASGVEPAPRYLR